MTIEKLFYSIKAEHDGAVHSLVREIDPKGFHSKCNSYGNVIIIHGAINV
jgi:hypothetical protein